MYCKKCGNMLPDGENLCANCQTYTEGFDVNENQNGAENNGTYYTPPQAEQNGYSYGDGNYGQQSYDSQRIISKGDTAQILAILGIVLSVMVTPILGWVLGAIALNNAKEVYALTGNESYLNTIKLAKWSIAVASIVTALYVLIFICVFLFAFVFAVSVPYSMLVC